MNTKVKANAETRYFPIGKIDVAEENARYGRDAINVEALAANIKQHGLLQPLLGYELKGRVKVFAGARRLAALKANGAPDAPVQLRDRAEARKLSVAENDQREDMHPAEEARAWADMIAKGDDVVAIANAYGKTERFVLQRIKLAKLHPPIFLAFLADQIDLDIAEAYAGAPAERQADLWKRFGKRANRYTMKEALGKGKLASTDRIAKYVGEAAYRAAGGRVEEDLFADVKDGDAASYWLDRAIAEKCVEEKLAKLVEKVKAEGWAFVERHDAYYGNDFTRVAFSTKTKAAKAKCGALVQLTHGGGAEVLRGMARRGSAAAKAKASKAAGKPGTPAPAAPITNTAHEQMTRIASRIVGRSIAADYDAALVAMTAFLVRIVFADEADVADYADYGDARVIDLADGRNWDGGAGARPLELSSDAANTKAREQWFAGLPVKFDATLERWLIDMPRPKLQQLFAFCVGEKIRHVEMKPRDADEDCGREVLGVLGELADAVPSDHWTPDKAWLLGLSKEELAKAARAVGAPIGKTKSATADAIAAAAKAKRWTPPAMLELLVAPKVAPPTKAPATKKRAAAAVSKSKRVRERSCRVCGCTEAQACPGGCHWVGRDLCSACA